MNREQIESFEKLHNQLFGMYEEISLLSKKNPNDAINKFKLKYINKLLIDSNFFLHGEYKPFEDFDNFEEDDIPQNGDVVFIISQYLKCFDNYKSNYVIQRQGTNWFWKYKGTLPDYIDDKGFSYLRTSKPQNFADKKL
ncbi:hypothetical protein [Acinetobacter beijerinckii]|jgi:hypothetical protein|uniref:hypothetical protein n=1 Tax=Acinetobacter beijerinckii TaxID=262668 RepID=UPI002404A206|nr:hypothetical protein [Acinetobacter beijerinckii]